MNDQTHIRSLVVVPTYNEADNISRILDVLTSLSVPVDVLVVDDSSPDGTADQVTDHPLSEKNIFLLKRAKKEGLGTAYKAGFAWALERDYEVCLEMDADFSHDPQDIPRLLQGIKEGNDLVIGSRYVNGISVINWPLRRLLISIGAGIYTRFFTGLPLADPTSGFKAFHRTVLESLDWNEVKSEGYCFQIEIHFKVFRKGFRIKEIPIVFTERRDGKSKLSSGVAMEAAMKIPRFGLSRLLPGNRKTKRPHRSGK